MLHFRYLSVTIIIFLNTLEIASSQVFYDDPFTYSEVVELLDLYKAQLHNVVTAKLKNKGYNLTESTPDYEINGKAYSGDYSFEKMINYGVIEIANKWKFKTIEYLDFASEYQIEFNIASSVSGLTYNALVSDFNQNGYYEFNSPFCHGDYECIRLGKVNNIHCEFEGTKVPEFELYPFWTRTWVRYSNYPMVKIEQIENIELTVSTKAPDGKKSLKGNIYINEFHHIITDTLGYMKKTRRN